jgi:hypothetical protein
MGKFQKCLQPVQFAFAKEFHIYPAFCPANDCTNGDDNDVNQFMILRPILRGSFTLLKCARWLLWYGYLRVIAIFTSTLPHFRCDCPVARINPAQIQL